MNKVNIVSFSYTWTISGFRECESMPGECLESAVFGNDPNTKSKWKLELYPRGLTADSQDYVSLYLCLVSTEESKVKAEYKFSILNAKSKKACKKKAEKLFVADDFKQRIWGNERYVKRDYLLNKKNKLLENGNLTILVKIKTVTKWTYGDADHESKSSSMSYRVMKNLSGSDDYSSGPDNHYTYKKSIMDYNH